MGNKMTSTPYGLKVKEHTNHADYKDIFEDVVFKIYYNESTHVWTIKSNYDRLWSEGTQYLKGDTILEFTNTLTQEKTVLGQYDQEGTEVYRNIMYRIKCYQGEAGAGRTKQMIQITGGYSSKTYDKETVCTDILHTHTSVYYNGKWHVGMYLLYDNPSIANCWMKKVGSLAITYAKPIWFLMTTQAGIEYSGQVYEARKLIRSWRPDEFVNMSLYYHKTRKRELPNPDTDKFDKLVYDVQCFAPDGQVTLTYEINTVPQDSVTFYPSDSPVRFHNIEFRASSDKWTIYSKCGYIKFDGKTYKTNKSIFSVGFDENLHVEIKDESNIYEIEETTTYTVRSVQVGSISYKLWTTTIDKTIKIEKTVDTVVEPWITVRYYEAMYEPVTIDDLILEFSNVDMKWYLKSNNDDLYCNGSNYKKGELIDYWEYEYIQNLKYITVLVTSAEDGIEIKKISSGDIPYLNNDIDEVYDDGLKICHSSTKGLWEIVSVDDETYYNGIQFLEGQTIVSFRDKTILDQFTILVKKIIEGEEEYDNVMYTCYTGVDLINGITTLTVNGMSWADKSATDANKSVIVTKDTARSMYGYIWQKEETPPHPDWPYYDIIVYSYYRANNRNYYKLTRIYYRGINTYRRETIKSSNYNSDNVDIMESSENRIYLSPNYNFGTFTENFGDSFESYYPSINWNNYVVIQGFFIKLPEYGTYDNYELVFGSWIDRITYIAYLNITNWSSDPYVTCHKQRYSIMYNRIDLESDEIIEEVYYGGISPLNTVYHKYIQTFKLNGYGDRSGNVIFENGIIISINPLDNIWISLHEQYTQHSDIHNRQISVKHNSWRPIDFSYTFYSPIDYEWLNFQASSNMAGSIFMFRIVNSNKISDYEWKATITYLNMALVYDFNTDTAFLYDEFPIPESEADAEQKYVELINRQYDLTSHAYIFDGKTYSCILEDDKINIYEQDETNPFIWTLVESKDVGTIVSIITFLNNSSEYVFTNLTFGERQLYSDNRCGFVPENSNYGTIYFINGTYCKDGNGISGDKYVRATIKVDDNNSTQRFNILFDNPYLNNTGLTFAFLD